MPTVHAPQLRFRRYLWLPILLAALSGCASLVPPPPRDDNVVVSAQAAMASWSRVLAERVDDRGHVDFDALAAQPQDLDRYVRYIADTPLQSFADPLSLLAHQINAYNALSMYNVIRNGIPQTHAGFTKIQFFLLRKLEVGGEAISLYRFENSVIRPLANRLGLPEVHFALNCSAVSCPVLPRAPFRAAGLRDQLERESRLFFSRPENFRIDSGNRIVWLSEILNFYTEDFVPTHGANLIEYANRYSPRVAPVDYEVRFLPYDWTVANMRLRRPTQ
jgi:hypothetical protein